MDGAVFCRGCLSRHDEPDDLVQYSERTRRQFVYSTGLQVKKTDAFTFQLCKECYINMKMGCKFKKQCRASDKKFKKYIGLKECGATEDFAAFLAKDDDEFRFPYISGGITPSYQRPKEDDNESTNTSIRNFMTNLVRPEDLPEPEARIVNELIVEEADILEDSLDSLWLQDDPSLDADNMDISFSAFSTPREDRCVTPRMIDEPMNTVTNAIKPNFGTKYKPKVYADFIVDPDVDAAKNDPKPTIPPRQTLRSMPDIESIVPEENVPAFDSGAKDVLLEETMKVFNHMLKDTIDKNLKKGGLLASPANTDIALPSSPTKSIKSILYGHYYEANENDVEKMLPTTELHWPKPLKNIQFNVDLSPTGQRDPIESGKDTVDEILKEASSCTDTVDEILKEASSCTDTVDEILKEASSCTDTVDEILKEASSCTDTVDEILKEASSCTDTVDEILKEASSCTDTVDEILKEASSCTDTVDEILKEASANLEVNDEPIKLNFYVDTQQDVCSSSCNEPDQSIAKNTRNPFTVNRATYQCPICHEEIQHESYFKRHLSKHEITSKLYCKICCVSFKDIVEKRQHSMEVHQKVQKVLFVCEHCGKKFYDTTNYKRHLKSHEKQDQQSSYLCDQCGRSVANKARLLLHLRTHHIFKNLPHDSYATNRKVVTKERECPVCGVIVKGQNYYTHKRLHNESLLSHPCQYCDKKFNRRTELNNHIGTIHAGSATLTHACYKCERIFMSTYTLNRHIQRVHIGDTCFKCNECNGEFPSKKKLRHHLFSAHDFTKQKEDAVKKIKCAHCEQMFHSIRAVNVHITKSKKCLKLRNKEFDEFTCPYCEAKFLRQGDLNIHIKNTRKCLTARKVLASVDARKFPCAHCEQMFRTNRDLNNHINQKCLKLHNNELDVNAFTCPYCDAKFMRKTDLKFHIKNTRKCLTLRNIGITSEVQCRLCNTYVGAGNALKKHMLNCAKSIKIKSLTDTGFYKCIFCSNTFDTFKLLSRHMKTSSICLASRSNLSIEKPLPKPHR